MRKYIYILALCITAAAVRATPVDPKIIVSGGGDPTAVETSVFTFMSDAAGGGVLSFVNETGFDWLRLNFFVNLPTGSTISCSSTIYNTCDISSTTIPDTNLSVFDIALANAVDDGITPGEDLTVNLNDTGTSVDGSGGWGPNNTFTAVINLPEPSSFFFLASGILLLGGLRRYSRRIYF